jgi:hypothetical protein
MGTKMSRQPAQLKTKFLSLKAAEKKTTPPAPELGLLRVRDTRKRLASQKR